MKFNSIFLQAILGLLVSCETAAAHWEVPETHDVPVDRLVTNLEKYESKLLPALQNKERARIEFQIGRLYSMSFATKSDQAKESQSTPTKGQEAPQVYFGYGPEHHQLPVAAPTSAQNESWSHGQLTKAIAHLRNSVELDPSLIGARFGLAWCLDQQGEKGPARELYRTVFDEAYIKECGKTGFSGRCLTKECGEYLIKLLNPSSDSKEIAEIQAKMKKANENFRKVTPILIPLTKNARLSELIQQKPVVFALDGQQPRKHKTWITPKAGWLIFDPAGTRQVYSGVQLIGEVTFWIFWNDGYEVLRALDDDGNGFVSGDELSGLAVWQDLNCDGVAQTDEVLALSSLKIKSLNYRCDYKGRDYLKCSNGVVLEDGIVLPTFDVWIR
ncbi:MAG TPA: tetratricopeptide repeat protein [Oculatellaceae cyanobacterium]